jgi:hypothetical protein
VPGAHSFGRAFQLTQISAPILDAERFSVLDVPMRNDEARKQTFALNRWRGRAFAFALARRGV